MNKEKIAEFIGMQSTNIGWFDNEGVLSKIEKDNTFDILKFDTDFNWLIAVVDFIEEMEINNNTFTFEIQKESVTIFQYGTYNMEIVVEETEGATRLENLYNAVLKWIELFNKNKF